jgi:phage-related protein
MAAAMNNGVVDTAGLKTANIQLGKALNDPVKGITALSKVGVSFTEQQKAQIATMVKAGDTAGAQKIILGELGKEFGGAAAAAADPMTRLKTILGNLGERIGTFLLPLVTKFANFLAEKAVPAIAAFADKIAGFVRSEGFQSFLGDVREKAVELFGFFKAEVLPRLKDFGGFIAGTVVPALKDMAAFIGRNKDFFIPFVATIATLVAGLKAWAIVQGALNVVMSLNPIGLVVVAIAALAAGVIYAYKHSETGS